MSSPQPDEQPQPPEIRYPSDGYEPPHYQPPQYSHGQYGDWYAPRPPAQPRQNRSGLAGALGSIGIALMAFFKYGGILLLKIPALTTLLTLLLSFGLYAWRLGPVAAAGIVVMIFLHEMGHVVEIRRQGLAATAPIFIPFFGAGIFQRSMPQDALKQAEIGIAGPVAGTMASIVALVLYTTTGWPFLLVWAGFGFFVNLLNLIPFGMLDGGWILGAASKWFQVVGAVLLAAAVIVLHLSLLFVGIIVLLMGPSVLARFRNDRSPYYQSVPIAGRWLMGLAWVGLVAILAFGLIQVQAMFTALR